MRGLLSGNSLSNYRLDGSGMDISKYTVKLNNESLSGILTDPTAKTFSDVSLFNKASFQPNDAMKFPVVDGNFILFADTSNTFKVYRKSTGALAFTSPVQEFYYTSLPTILNGYMTWVTLAPTPYNTARLYVYNLSAGAYVSNGVTINYPYGSPSNGRGSYMAIGYNPTTDRAFGTYNTYNSGATQYEIRLAAWNATAGGAALSSSATILYSISNSSVNYWNYAKHWSKMISNDTIPAIRFNGVYYNDQIASQGTQSEYNVYGSAGGGWTYKYSADQDGTISLYFNGTLMGTITAAEFKTAIGGSTDTLYKGFHVRQYMGVHWYISGSYQFKWVDILKKQAVTFMPTFASNAMGNNGDESCWVNEQMTFHVDSSGRNTAGAGPHVTQKQLSGIPLYSVNMGKEIVAMTNDCIGADDLLKSKGSFIAAGQSILTIPARLIHT